MGYSLHNSVLGGEYTLHQIPISFVQYYNHVLDDTEYGQCQFHPSLQSLRTCKLVLSSAISTDCVRMDKNLTGHGTLFALQMGVFNAPFFTTWFSTNWMVLFFPVYYCVQLASSRALTPAEILSESSELFRNNRYTAGQ